MHTQILYSLQLNSISKHINDFDYRASARTKWNLEQSGLGESRLHSTVKFNKCTSTISRNFYRCLLVFGLTNIIYPKFGFLYILCATPIVEEKVFHKTKTPHGRSYFEWFKTFRAIWEPYLKISLKIASNNVCRHEGTVESMPNTGRSAPQQSVFWHALRYLTAHSSRFQKEDVVILWWVWCTGYWEDNTDLQEMGQGHGLDWSGSG